MAQPRTRSKPRHVKLRQKNVSSKGVADPDHCGGKSYRFIEGRKFYTEKASAEGIGRVRDYRGQEPTDDVKRSATIIGAVFLGFGLSLGWGIGSDRAWHDAGNWVI